MQNRQYDLCIDVLRRLQKAGVLSNLVLVGSWCLLLYREYFKDVGMVPAVKTRDMDFLVPPSTVFKAKTDIPELLKDLGFILGFRGEHGVMILEHPELLIEFLVPELGRGGYPPKKLPALGMNAQALRFMDAALIRTVQLPFGGFPVVAPHPAVFALHKLLVAPRRKTGEKKRKDIDAALMILDLLQKKGEMNIVHDIFSKLPRAWRSRIIATLEADQQNAIAAALAV
jgi:hypothetical protein